MVKKVGGYFQLDMSFTTILVFGGEYRRLYRETQLSYIIIDHENTTKHPIYVVEKDLGSSILHLTSNETRFLLVMKQSDTKQDQKTETKDQIWKMLFDGSSSREGSGAGVVLISPPNQVISLSY